MWPLHISNLPCEATGNDVRRLFKAHNLPIKTTKTIKRCDMIVHFHDFFTAAAAFKVLDGREFMGRKLVVKPYYWEFY